MDIDTINQLRQEDKEVREWEQKEKNRILRMTNTQRKQVEWNNLFPKLPEDNMVY